MAQNRLPESSGNPCQSLLTCQALQADGWRSRQQRGEVCPASGSIRTATRPCSTTCWPLTTLSPTTTSLTCWSSARGPVWTTSAVPLPLHLSEGPLYRTRTSSASSCALRPNEWTSSVSPCPQQPTLQPGPTPAPTELSTKGTDRFLFVFVLKLMKVWTALFLTRGEVNQSKASSLFICVLSDKTKHCQHCI